MRTRGRRGAIDGLAESGRAISPGKIALGHASDGTHGRALGLRGNDMVIGVGMASQGEDVASGGVVGAVLVVGVGLAFGPLRGPGRGRGGRGRRGRPARRRGARSRPFVTTGLGRRGGVGALGLRVVG